MNVKAQKEKLTEQVRVKEMKFIFYRKKKNAFNKNLYVS